MYQKILVPLDGSELAECVLPHVEAIARGCGVTDVIFLRVAEPARLPIGDEYSPTAKEWDRSEAENRLAGENYLNQLVNRLNWEGVSIRTEVISGRSADSIADYATENEVDLIVIATHGRTGISRWLLGSVSDRVLHSARAPVLMVRAPGLVPGT